MRQPTRISIPHRSRQVRVLRYLVILCALCFAARAYADDRSEARAHYQAGVKFYSSGDYRGAIREFSAAQQLVPADLNNYNLALCYDKLGDAEPAIQYYRAFLDRQPGTDKRSEIEASISRLEAAARSAAAKRAEEARKAGPVLGPAPGPVAGPAAPPPPPAAAPPPPPPAAAPAPPAAPVPVAAPALPPAPVPAPAIAPAPPPVAAPAPPPAVAPAPPRRPGPAVAAPPPPATAGSIGTPGSGTPVGTGDSQLDRVNSISIDDIRDQRAGLGGPHERRPGPAVAAASPDAQGQLPPPGSPAPGGPQGADDPGPGPAVVPPNGSDQPKKEDPVYKKWWFWAVVAVSGYVVYQLASSSSSTSAARTFPQAAADPGGLTLLRW